MQLRRIEIRDFRKLGHVVVDGLEDGLNVIVGDNEAGKSTILAALRAALFERHRISGEVANGMLPYNQAVRPEITVDFDIAGRSWRLRKAFCQKPEAELHGPAERYLNDEAEERLASLLGFTHPGRGGSKPEEHQGIYGLCWVDQGAAHRSLGMGAGRESVASALETEVGQMVGGERGRALVAKAEERRDAAWTKTGRPRGVLKVLQDEVAMLSATRDDLRLRLNGLHEKVERLTAVQAAVERIEREERLPNAVAALAKARATAAHAEEVRYAAAQAAAEVRRAERERDNAAERAASRQALATKIARARAVLAEAERSAEQARVIAAGREGAVRAAHERLTTAKAEHMAAVDNAAATEAALSRRQDLDRLRKFEAQLAFAEAAELRRRTAAARAANISITKVQVTELERLEIARDRARYQLEAASVRISFQPEGASAVSIDGQQHAMETELLLTRDASLHLGGFGTLTVHPGGGVEALANALERLAGSFADALRAARIESVAAARSAMQAKDDATRDADAERKAVDAAAPRGLNVLRDEVDRLRGLVAQPLALNVSNRLETATATVLSESRRAVTEAQNAVRERDGHMEDLRAVRDEAATDAATLVERAAAARREYDAGLQELGDARARLTDEQLFAQVTQAESILKAALQVEAANRAAADQADPGSDLMLQKAERAERAVREDLERQKQSQRELEIELRTLGRDGLGEQLSEVEGTLERVRKQAEAKAREGTAASLLHETLVAAQRESKDRWLGPIRERVRPYLRLIQSDTEVVLNEETLELAALVRRGHQEPFSALSVGAREQVAVITRLALAEILQGSGKPSTVILDDALVNTDEARLERMHLVLNRAAQSLQILVLTCRERDFAQVGAPIRRIA